MDAHTTFPMNSNSLKIAYSNERHSIFYKLKGTLGGKKPQTNTLPRFICQDKLDKTTSNTVVPRDNYPEKKRLCQFSTRTLRRKSWVRMVKCCFFRGDSDSPWTLLFINDHPEADCKWRTNHYHCVISNTTLFLLSQEIHREEADILVIYCTGLSQSVILRLQNIPVLSDPLQRPRDFSHGMDCAGLSSSPGCTVI